MTEKEKFMEVKDSRGKVTKYLTPEEVKKQFGDTSIEARYAARKGASSINKHKKVAMKPTTNKISLKEKELNENIRALDLMNYCSQILADSDSPQCLRDSNYLQKEYIEGKEYLIEKCGIKPQELQNRLDRLHYRRRDKVERYGNKNSK